MSVITLTASDTKGLHIGDKLVYADAHDGASSDPLIDNPMSINAIDGGFYIVGRGMLIFPSPAIGGKIIDSAILKLYLTWKSGDGNIFIQSGQPTYPHNPIVAGDFLYTYYSGDGGNMNYSGWSLNNYHDIPLSSAGLGYINKTGETKLCLRLQADINNTTPIANNYAYYGTAFTAGQEPKLEITYHDAPSVSGSSGAKKLMAIGILNPFTKKVKGRKIA